MKKPVLPFCLECNDTGWLEPVALWELSQPCPHCDTGAAIAEGEDQMPEHTPGPWVDHEEDGCITAELTDDGKDMPEGVCLVLAGPHAEANADLIKAAPEMLTVLQDFVRTAYEQDLRLGGLVGAAEVAIAKALGNS